MISPASPAPRPPKGFRPHMSVKVKLEAVLMHAPILDDEGNKVCALADIDFDHQPPLQMRVWDPVNGDTIPPANDPAHIVPLARKTHRQKTAKRDVPEIAKTRRLAKDQDEFRRTLLAKECGQKRQPHGKIRSRGFPKKIEKR